YITLPAPAASTCWPSLPEISMPLLLASSKLAITLPSAGHIQLTPSSSEPAGAVSTGFSTALLSIGLGGSNLATTVAPPVSGFCNSANALSEYGRFSPRGPVLLAYGPCGPFAAAGWTFDWMLESGRTSTPEPDTAAVWAPLPDAPPSGGSTRSTWSTLMSFGLLRLFHVMMSR